MSRDRLGDAGLLEELRRSREMLAAAQQLARIGSWEWDVAAGRVTWSDELFRIYGHEPQAFEPTYESFLERVHPDDREAVDERNRRAFAAHEPFDDVKRVRRVDGSEFLMRTQGEVLVGPDGTVMRMLGVCEDVTDRIRAQEAQALLASIVRSSNDAIFTLTRDGHVTSWNPAAERLFGWPAEEAAGQQVLDLVPSVDPLEDFRLSRTGLRSLTADAFETDRLCRDGRRVPVSVVVSPVLDPAGGVVGISVVARDITERRRFEDQLRHLAERDALTGLYNRRHFEGELGRALAHAVRYGAAGAVLVLDLDNFKHVNDAFGHGAGDEVIRSVARVLRSRLRSTDVLARLGGDEFAVLLPHAGVDEARRVGRDMVAAVRDQEIQAGGRRVRVTASLGAALVDPGAASGDTLLAAADAALYAAKDAGRDRSVVLAPGERRTARVADWQDRIERALDEGGLELHLQPIQDLATGAVRRYEALLRMTTHGEVALPGRFLPTAERVGLIHDIDRWVVREAVRLLALHPRVELEVNLSGRSLDDEDVVEVIACELGRTGVEPERLIIEVTETAAVANMDDARRLAAGLTRLGCPLAIDDFGAGFGSFAYLKHLPVSYLKIDGDFVASPRSRADELVIGAIVGMARGLGKRTVAEHVGDDTTMRMLRAAGVDYAQGYHVGHPFPARELI